MNEETKGRRKGGIGGSDAAAILGLSKWRTPLDVYMEKLGQLPPQSENPAMRWGTLLEPVIIEEFERATDLRVDRSLPLLVSDVHPFMLGNLDGLASDGAIVEAKTARSDADWGEPGSGEIPVYYQPQVAHYMALTGAKLAYVPVLIGASDFRIYAVQRDESFIRDLIDAERAFWHDHVLAEIPPDPINAADAAKLWARDSGASVEVDAGLAGDIAALRDLKGTIKTLEEQAGALDERIRVAFKDAAALTYGGAVLATYKSQSARRVDLKALEAAHPDIAAEFRKESVQRVLRIK